MSSASWKRAFELLDNYLDLSPELVREIMRDILQGDANSEELKRFLLALKEKGETSDEVGALVAEMYEHSAPISIDQRAVDIVGTGGDKMNTINISTMSAIVAAAAGAVVAVEGRAERAAKDRARRRADGDGLVEALGLLAQLALGRREVLGGRAGRHAARQAERGDHDEDDGQAECRALRQPLQRLRQQSLTSWRY